MGLVLFVSLLLIHVQKCPLSTASFFLVAFSHSFVSEKQPAVTGALALDSGLALACLHYVTLEKSSSITVPQFLYKMEFGEYLLYGAVVNKSRCQTEPLELEN